jgi:hypothetical protein
MKLFVIIILLIFQYFLFRIAFPKLRKTKQGDDVPRKRETDISGVVVKTRFVRPESSQPRPTHATVLKTEYQEEKPSIFAGGNEKKDAVIPPGKLDEVFGEETTHETGAEPNLFEVCPVRRSSISEGNEPNTEELEIESDDESEESDEPDLEEENEDLLQTPAGEAEQADGLSIEEMTEAVEAIDNPTDEKAAILYRVEKTDMFEQLVSGDEGRAARIKAIIERNIRSLQPEVETEKNEKELNGDNDNGWENFDIQNYLHKTIKK